MNNVNKSGINEPQKELNESENGENKSQVKLTNQKIKKRIPQNGK